MVEMIRDFVKKIAEKGFFHLLSANLLIQIVAFASQLFVAHILSPDDIGRIKIIQVFISIFSIIGGMGFGLSTLKLCSEEHETAYKKTIFHSAILFTLFTSLFSYVILIMATRWGLVSNDKTIMAIAPFAFLPIVFGAIFTQLISYLQALKRIKTLSFLTITNKVLTIILILIFSYLKGLNGYFYALNIGLILILLHSFWNIRGDLHIRHIDKKTTKKLFFTHWFYAKPALLSNLLGETTAFIDIILINYLIHSATDIGYYSFAVTLIVALRIVPSTIQQISNPYFSEKGLDKNIVHQIFIKYSKLLLLIIILSLLLFLLLVPLGIRLFFEKYILSIQYLIPLSIAWSIRQFNQITASALFGMGKIKYIAYSQLVALVANLLIIPISIHQWGLLGAAWMTIPCFIVNVMAMYLFYQKAVKSIKND